MLIIITMLTTAGMTVVLPILPFVVLRYVPDASHLAVWVGVLETVNALCAFTFAPLHHQYLATRGQSQVGLGGQGDDARGAIAL